MRGLYFKKKEIDRSGDRAPVDLLEKIRGLVIELKAKRNRIESQKLQYASKFEKKKYNIVAATLNSSSAAGLGASLFKIKGVDEEMKELAKRIEKVENLKVGSKLTG